MDIKTPLQIRLTSEELTQLDTYIDRQGPFKPSRTDVAKHALLVWLAAQVAPAPVKGVPPPATVMPQPPPARRPLHGPRAQIVAHMLAEGNQAARETALETALGFPHQHGRLRDMARDGIVERVSPGLFVVAAAYTEEEMAKTT